MSYCEKMNRPCTCGKLVTYDRSGRVHEWTSGARCLTDTEVLSTMNFLTQEWRRRFNNSDVPVLPQRA
jgi:hypothetical protein